MKTVIHYTIGFHQPMRGGVETAISDFAKMTPEYRHIVFCKNGSNELTNLFGNTYSLRSVQGHNSVECRKYKHLSDNIPDVSMEFDATTIARMKSVSPDIIIVYGGDDEAMYIPLHEIDNVKKIIRIQQYVREFDLKYMSVADCLIAFSYRVADMFEHKGWKKDIHIVSKAYDDSIFNIDGRQEFDRSKVLYTGRFCPLKRVTELVGAFNKVKRECDGSVLTLVGGATPHSYMSTLDKSIAADSCRISLKGWLSHEDLAAEYKRNGIVIIPSRYETFCSSALEALACGCMVLVNNNTMGWADEMVYNGCCMTPGNKSGSINSNIDGIEKVLKFGMTTAEYKDYSSMVYERHSYTMCAEKYRKCLND